MARYESDYLGMAVALVERFPATTAECVLG